MVQRKRLGNYDTGSGGWGVPVGSPQNRSRRQLIEENTGKRRLG